MAARKHPVVTGAHLVETLLHFGRTRLAEVLILRGGSARGLARIAGLADTAGVPVRWLDSAGMRKATSEDGPQVAAALAERGTVELESVVPSAPTPASLLVVEGVEDPFNLGMILRTALAAGVSAAVLDEHARAMSREALARSSAGASECLPLVFSEDIPVTIAGLGKFSVTSVAAVPEGGVNLFEARLAERVAIIVGGERRGLSKHLLATVMVKVTIPMSRELESLPAVVGAAVMLYEVLRRREG